MSAPYNGWTNYETWVVALWMANGEGSHRYWTEKAQEVWDHAAGKSQTRLSDTIKDEYEEAAPDLGASVWTDLLSAAMSEVDWYSIAGHLLTNQERMQQP